MGRIVSDGLLLAGALRDPMSTTILDSKDWNALLAIARAEQLIGSLAWRLHGVEVPVPVTRILEDARRSAEQCRVAALWEAEMTRRAFGAADIPVILLKGTAFVAAGLAAGVGRSIGDLDILVPHERIDAAEAALLAAGWEWVKSDAYDDVYYRRWMHELPPLIHRERDRMIDVHHTILPLTARVRPNAAALIADSVEFGSGLRMLSPQDVMCHAAAHLFADGDLAGGLRNLWDMHCLLDEFGSEGLVTRADLHGLGSAVARAARLSHALYGTQVPEGWQRLRGADPLYLRRLTARDGWGRPTRRLTRFGFYVRSHAIRMPPTMLLRHLWTKWRKGHVPR
ncbi:nucleotidyltransferase domain-containing protein [Sphingomonas xinjiangensis]|uniref:WW domain-containing protein n=1 Tax=Sphingomonas xinjiangensis TaxID=643568 RepID=A0A840YEZ5_9SPHN|nr:nucleotidyltransferase family protein [Sphingomonas xinjiangensis]MBB5710539.1 hypothetical protein [Sphingomonas xinjiangensis]